MVIGGLATDLWALEAGLATDLWAPEAGGGTLRRLAQNGAPAGLLTRPSVAEGRPARAAAGASRSSGRGTEATRWDPPPPPPTTPKHPPKSAWS